MSRFKPPEKAQHRLVIPHLCSSNRKGTTSESANVGVLLQVEGGGDVTAWLSAIHTACAASMARHLNRDSTIRLLQAKMRQLEISIDLVRIIRATRVAWSVCLCVCLSDTIRLLQAKMRQLEISIDLVRIIRRCRLA